MSSQTTEEQRPATSVRTEAHTRNLPTMPPPALASREYVSPDPISYIGRFGVATIALAFWCSIALLVWLFVILRTIPTLALRLVLDLYDGGGTRCISRIDQIAQIWPHGFRAILRAARGQSDASFNPHCTPLQALIDTALATPFYISIILSILYAPRFFAAVQSAHEWATR